MTKNYEKALIQIDKIRMPDMILFDGYLNKGSPDEHFNIFGNICRTLVSEGAYEIICKVIAIFFFFAPSQLDYDSIYKIFQDIKVNEKYNLDDIRQLYLQELDRFYEDKSAVRNRFDKSYVATKMTICKYILGMTEVEIPDGIPLEICEEICERCAEIKRGESYPVVEKFTFGILCSILPAYRFSNDGFQISLDMESYFGILNKKILPIFNKYYSQNTYITGNHMVFLSILRELRVLCHCKLFFRYYEFENLESFSNIIKENFSPNLFIQKLSSCYKNDEFSYGDFDEIPDEVLKSGEALTKLCLESEPFFTYMDLNYCYCEERDFIEDLFIIALVLLYMNEQENQCRRLLVKYRHKISPKHLHAPYAKLLIAKLFLSCDNLHDARSLATLAECGISAEEVRERKGELKEACESIIEQFEKIRAQSSIYRIAEIDAIILTIKQQNIEYRYPQQFDFENLCCIILSIMSNIDEIPSELLDDAIRLFNSITRTKGIMDAYYPIIEQSDLWFLMKMMFDKHLANLSIKSALEDFQKIKAMKKNRPIDDYFFEELDKSVSELLEIYAKFPRDNIDLKNAKDNLRKSILAFTSKYFSENPDKNLFSKLSSDTEEDVKKYLQTSELVYKYLDNFKKDDVDFAPALISLTKAIELILSEKLYAPMKAKIDNKPDNAPKYPSNIRTESIGAYVALIWDIENKKTSKITEQDGRLTVSNPNNHFDFYGGNDCLDIGALKRFNGMPILTLDYNLQEPDKTETPVTRRFGDNDDENRLLLACALDYVRGKYRNPVAHKDIIAKSLFEEANQSILYKKEYQNAQGLLFVLLSILK